MRGARRTRTTAARDLARHLRKKSTGAGKSLWRLLRGSQFEDFKFRRQYPCGIWFLDFQCVEAKRAVELDGGGHGFPDQRARGGVRDQFLASMGIKELRFWDHQMHGELEAVRFEIWNELMLRTGRADAFAGFLAKPAIPHPNPLSSKRVGGIGWRTLK